MANGYNLDGTDNDRIRAFLAKRENEFNCDCCPYQNEVNGNNQQLPCGQYHCWVTVSCQ